MAQNPKTLVTLLMHLGPQNAQDVLVEMHPATLLLPACLSPNLVGIGLDRFALRHLPPSSSILPARPPARPPGSFVRTAREMKGCCRK